MSEKSQDHESRFWRNVAIIGGVAVGAAILL